MKITGQRIKSFMASPDDGLRAILIYGPDSGLVKERAEILARGRVEDLNDPFGVVEISGSELKADPARLADEASAMTLGGGGRVVRVRAATDVCKDACKSFLELGTPAEALVLIEGAELGPRSSLRKLFEGAKNAAALPCYTDDARSLPDVIRETLKPHQLTVSRDAMSLLLQSLGADRGLTRGELEKLALYKGAPGEISIDDVRAAIGDAAKTTLDDVVYAAASGDMQKLDRGLGRTFDEGVHAVAVVRAAERHFQRLHLARGHMDGGKSAQDAMKSLRPPIIFMRADQFRAQLNLWPGARLTRAFDILTQAELDCKTTALPAEAICGRALIQIGQAAKAARR